MQGLAQELRVLPESVLERIARLEELAEYYLDMEDDQLAVSYYNQISYTYWENQRPDKAVEYFYKAVPLYKRLNDLENLHKLYSNIGLIYLDLENIPEADKAFAENLDIQRQTGDRQGITTALVDLAYVKNLQEDYREANKLLEEALEIALEINYETVLPNIYKQLSNNYTNVGNIRQGQDFQQKYNDVSEHITRETMRGEFEQKEEESQIEILRQQADARIRELEMEKSRIEFQIEQDSIASVVKEKEEALIEQQRIERIQRQDIEILENKARLNEAEIERQKAVQNFQQLIIYSTLGGLGLIMILVILMYRSNKAKQRANRQLAQKNTQIEQAKEKLQEAFVKIEDQNFRITQSISYAREIQRALFPPIETLSAYLPESFIFFRPVDMVSGDFYWFKEAFVDTQSKKELSEARDKKRLPGKNGDLAAFQSDKFIITAVDCTGHGVPGAFMSMIGYNLLDSITSSGTTHPDRILSKLHSGVRDALKQDETTNRDGMDISMCVINKENKTVEFAGANNPVIYISDDGKLEIIKGDRMAIGGSHKRIERKYSPHTIAVDKPTTFYILTDGYTDQFGGENRKKYSMKNLTELLLTIHQKDMKEQRTIIEQEFETWKGEGEQIDDVLIIGFKLK
jgi:serine phosphatase RsbU (regulator of sigma subunit)